MFEVNYNGKILKFGEYEFAEWLYTILSFRHSRHEIADALTADALDTCLEGGVWRKEGMVALYTE